MSIEDTLKEKYQKKFPRSLLTEKEWKFFNEFYEDIYKQGIGGFYDFVHRYLEIHDIMGVDRLFELYEQYLSEQEGKDGG